MVILLTNKLISLWKWKKSAWKLENQWFRRSFNKRVWLVLTNIWGNWYIHSRTKLCTPFTACVLLCYECFVILCKFTLFNKHVAGVFTFRNDSSNSTKFWDTESFDQAIFQNFPDHFLSNSRLQNSTREYGIHR